MATTADATASISARQCASTAAAVSRRATTPALGGDSPAASSASENVSASLARASLAWSIAAGHNFTGSGSMPSTIWDSRSVTALVSRSPNVGLGLGRPLPV
jgi:hypothetical protein